jgi:hypothetical protein
VTSLPEVEGSVKSGAGAPTGGRVLTAAYFRAASYRFATSLQFTTFHQADT